MTLQQMYGMLRFHERAEKAYRAYGDLKNAESALKHANLLRAQIIAEKDSKKEM